MVPVCLIGLEGSGALFREKKCIYSRKALLVPVPRIGVP